MTLKRQLCSSSAMANKTVTKKSWLMLASCPRRRRIYQSRTRSSLLSPLIKGKQIVVKPKSTNFGLGISIFQEPASLDNYKKALEIAFAEDTAVLVEEFIPGTEYRFFILTGVVSLSSLVSLLMLSVMANTPFVN